MANVLFLVHRLPYPPNKGDKVRSYHLLKHLAAKHRVFLGTFVDDPEDEAHVETVRGLCTSLHASRLHPKRARLMSLGGLATGKALTLEYYRDAALAAWVQQLRQTERIDAVVVFSSSMGQYAEGLSAPMLMDLVDVDSAKWTGYADAHRWPMSWLYRREGLELLRYERQVAALSQRVFLCTEKEADLFRGLAPESAGLVAAMGNGVDCDYFAPEPARPSPFKADELPIVFTGAMDYWPNIDAVQWFAQDMLPALRQRWPAARFHIVGRSPTPAVRALAGEHVNVTGTVADVRPYLQHAAAVVAPLRLARGIQNKILEAMAMQQPVVAAQVCVEAIDATPGEDLLAAHDTADYLQALNTLLADAESARRIGMSARRCVLQAYAWDARLAALDDALLSALNAPTAPSAHAPVREAA
jgi:sugar transferase (PEP-CTERM/EpsH1 system associated)